MNLTENLDKLPKWAQQEVSLLQRRLNEAKMEILRRDENPKSNTILGSNYSFQGQPIVYLKDNQTITFVLEKGDISARINKGVVDIMGHGEGDFIVKPFVSNSVQIKLI